MQNIPKGNKSKVKQVFKSRYGEGQRHHPVGLLQSGSLCAKLTRRIAAHRRPTGWRGHALHAPCGQGAHGYDEVYALCKGDAYDQEWDYKRTGAKVFSFQRAYGAGIPTIAKATGMTVEEVEALAAAEDARYPEINKFFDGLEKQIEVNAVPTSTFIAPGQPGSAGAATHQPASGIRTAARLPSALTSPAWQLKRGVTSTFSPTERKNYIVQRGGAQIMKATSVPHGRGLYKPGELRRACLPCEHRA